MLLREVNLGIGWVFIIEYYIEIYINYIYYIILLLVYQFKIHQRCFVNMVPETNKWVGFKHHFVLSFFLAVIFQ